MDDDVRPRVEVADRLPQRVVARLVEEDVVHGLVQVAERVMKERRTSAEERIVLAFRLVTARPPTEREAGLLRDALSSYLNDYKGDPEAARKYLSLGESPRDEELDVSELAAYSTLAGLILNLDETITRE